MNTNVSKTDLVVAAINDTSSQEFKSYIAFDHASTVIYSNNRNMKFFSEKDYETEIDKLIERGADVEKKEAMNKYYLFFRNNWEAIKLAELTK